MNLDPDSPDYNDTNQGDPRETPEEKEISALSTRLAMANKLQQMTLDNQIRAVERADELKKELDEAVMSTHRQAICINQCAAHIGPDTSATIDGLPLAVKRIVAERSKMAAVCDHILDIMETYHEQDASPRGVDTPGGLEHMGDVWCLFRKWETSLKASASESVVGGGGGFSSKPPSAEKQPNVRPLATPPLTPQDDA